MHVCCPKCKNEPDVIDKWECFCGEHFNHFETEGVCPSCNYTHEYTECQTNHCKEISLHLDWYSTIGINLKELKLNLDLAIA